MKTFVALSDVKQNGEYTFLNSFAPDATYKEPAYVNGDTWLDIVTGFSYILVDQTTGLWNQYETALDEKINRRKDKVFKTVIKYLNTVFEVDRNKMYLNGVDYAEDFPYSLPIGWTRKEAFQIFTYESVFSEWLFDAVDSDTFSITVNTELSGSIEDSFKEDDTIYISGSRRNDGYFTIQSLDPDNGIIYVDEELKSGIANAFIYLCDVPEEVIQIAADMCWFDVTVRPLMKGLKSEKIGTYSWTAADYGGLSYPENIVAGLETHRSISVGGQSVFVD